MQGRKEPRKVILGKRYPDDPGEVSIAKKILLGWLDSGRMAVEKVKPIKYTVELDVDEGQLLLHDRPLADQPPVVREALRRVVGSRGLTGQSFLDRVFGRPPEKKPDGYSLVRDAIKDKTLRKLTEQLQEAGVQGIKYRNGVTRGKYGEVDPESFNYVIFDDDRIKILAKNGEPVGRGDNVLYALHTPLEQEMPLIDRMSKLRELAEACR
jgi:hypothetical protein